MNNQNPTLDSQTAKTISETDHLVKARKEALQKSEDNTAQGFEWLNEHSRNFLASGYLTPGVTAEERIREIGERAEQILGIPGYADKFYHYMSEGFFS